MNRTRRNTIKFSSLGALLASLPLSIKTAFAEWPEAPFATDNYQTALNGVIGDATLIESGVTIEAPEIASNGATVPITISSDLPNIKTINIFVEKNPRPYISTFFMNDKIDSTIAVRVKMRETSDVIAIVENESGYHVAKQSVKVTAGGCA
jgi:sulfur-oxidizing protein SoxY